MKTLSDWFAEDFDRQYKKYGSYNQIRSKIARPGEGYIKVGKKTVHVMIVGVVNIKHAQSTLKQKLNGTSTESSLYECTSIEDGNYEVYYRQPSCIYVE